MNYKNIGFKCGLEVHQQLETHNLFCNCPSLVRDPNNPNIKFNRKLRASAGETGTIDLAAAFETKKGKKIFYEACSTSSCLVECDDEPPHKLNEDAIDTAIMIAMLLNAKIVDQIHVMRKVVVDGSNTTGFQRTMLIATDGYIETSKGKVSIPTICLEEESAQKLNSTDYSITYRLDRLGVPLIEVATGPDIKDPEHAKETASLLGMILRSTNRVKRGIGTIRQDVNLSIKTHPRVEVKGFQELRYMPRVIENEVQRQQKEKSGKPHVRKANPDGTTSFLRPMPGSARMYPETDHPPFEITPNQIKLVKIPELITEKALKLEKKYNLQPSLAKELLENKQFDFLVKRYTKLEPFTIAQILIETPKEIESRLKINASKLKEQDFEFVIKNLNENKIQKSAVINILSKLAENKKVNLADYEVISDTKLEQEVKKIVEANKGASLNAIMGEVMKKLQSKVDGKKAMELIKKFI
ncbi:MAG: Glu-tRNA(Gln) amidotransferase subunit GatE [Candidatus Nanoarchaeia archaeon]|nr:Glu-tRNA(Gln) amidotransferase subunit GatE [Candidatus Nanoarchaeia archaeon]